MWCELDYPNFTGVHPGGPLGWDPSTPVRANGVARSFQNFIGVGMITKVPIGCPWGTPVHPGTPQCTPVHPGTPRCTTVLPVTLRCTTVHPGTPPVHPGAPWCTPVGAVTQDVVEFTFSTFIVDGNIYFTCTSLSICSKSITVIARTLKRSNIVITDVVTTTLASGTFVYI